MIRKKPLILILSIIGSIIFIFVFFGFYFVLQSGQFIVMRPNITVQVGDESVHLVGYNINRERYIMESFVAERVNGGIDIWVSDEMEDLKIGLSSDGVQGGSYLMGDITDKVVISINNEIVTRSDGVYGLAYVVHRKDGSDRTLNIGFFFKNDILFAEPQKFAEQLNVHWVPVNQLLKLKKGKG